MAATAQAISSPPVEIAAPDYSTAIREKCRTKTVLYPIHGAGGTNISYTFDEREFVNSTQARLHAGGFPTALPRGCPEPLQGPLAWTGADLPDELVFLYHLVVDDGKAEIRDALAQSKALGLRDKEACNEPSRPPNLQTKLRQI